MRSIIISLIAFFLLILSIECKKSSSPQQVRASMAVVDLSGVQQTIRGFGGATAFIGVLDPSVFPTLFGNNGNQQLGLNVLRIRIDAAGIVAWHNELVNAQRALAAGATTIIASPWSPPTWYKSNHADFGGSINPASYTGYGQYLDSFINYMATNNAPVNAISVQNEPDITVPYESCSWTPDQLMNFVHGYSPVAGTKLIASESFHFNHAYTDPILQDSAANAHVSVIGGHIYGSGLAPYALATSHGKEVWMTEHLDTNITWTAALGTAKEINDCLAIANYSLYNWWYIKRFYGPIDESGIPTKRGYVMAQFSKYVRPGYQRVSVPNNLTPDVYISAYKKGASTVIVAINMSASPVSQPFTIGGGTAPASFTPHITSTSKSLSAESNVNVSGGGFTYVLPAQSVVTFESN